MGRGQVVQRAEGACVATTGAVASGQALLVFNGTLRPIPSKYTLQVLLGFMSEGRRPPRERGFAHVCWELVSVGRRTGVFGRVIFSPSFAMNSRPKKRELKVRNLLPPPCTTDARPLLNAARPS